MIQFIIGFGFGLIGGMSIMTIFIDEEKKDVNREERKR